MQQDNTRVHICKVAMDAVEPNGYELIHIMPIRLTELPATSSYKDIRGCHFRSDEEVVSAVEEWVNGKDPGFSVLGCWHLSTVCLSASHWSAITSKKKRLISTAAYLLIRPRTFYGKSGI